MDLGIKNKVALVTASSRGLGKAIAFQLSREGREQKL
jgi:3-oxoacyl-[acyl-carrier protein] reductase